MSLLYSFLWRRDDIVLQVLVRNGIVQQGDVLRNDDTLVSRHILISQFKTGVQNFLTGRLLDRQRGIVIEYPRYGCRGESSHRGFGQASSTGPPEIQGSRRSGRQRNDQQRIHGDGQGDNFIRQRVWHRHHRKLRRTGFRRILNKKRGQQLSP